MIKQLDPVSWKRTRSRILVAGDPKSRKTTSLLTWPRPIHPLTPSRSDRVPGCHRRACQSDPVSGPRRIFRGSTTDSPLSHLYLREGDSQAAAEMESRTAHGRRTGVSEAGPMGRKSKTVAQSGDKSMANARLGCFMNVGSWTLPSGNSCDVAAVRNPLGWIDIHFEWDAPPPFAALDSLFYSTVVVPAVGHQVAMRFGGAADVLSSDEDSA